MKEKINSDGSKISDGLIISLLNQENSLTNYFRPSQPTREIISNIGMIVYDNIWYKYLLKIINEGFDLNDKKITASLFFGPKINDKVIYNKSMLYFMIYNWIEFRKDITVGSKWSNNWLFDKDTIKDRGNNDSYLLELADKVIDEKTEKSTEDLWKLFGYQFQAKYQNKFGYSLFTKNSELFLRKLKSKTKLDKISELCQFISEIVYSVLNIDQMTLHGLVIAPNLSITLENINLEQKQYLLLITNENLFNLNFSREEINILFEIFSKNINGNRLLKSFIIYNYIKKINPVEYDKAISTNNVLFLSNSFNSINLKEVVCSDLGIKYHFKEEDYRLTILNWQYNLLLYYGEYVIRRILNEMTNSDDINITALFALIKKKEEYDLLEELFNILRKKENIDCLSNIYKNTRQMKFIDLMINSESLMHLFLNMLFKNNIIEYNDNNTINIIEVFDGDLANPVFTGVNNFLRWCEEFLI